MTLVMLVASAYHVVLGAWVVTLPVTFSGWIGLQRPAYPELWQYVGIILGVVGVGFGAAAFDPIRRWPFVLVGWVATLIGGLGLGILLLNGSITPKVGLILLACELIWWIPFGLIFGAALRRAVTRSYKRAEALPLREALSTYFLANGKSLAETSRAQPVLLCFLRHFG